MENLQNNELMVNGLTGEMVNAPVVVSETDEYKVVQMADGTFKRMTKYKRVHTINPEDLTEEKTVELFNVMNSTEEQPNVKPMKSEKDTVFVLKNVYTEPYSKLNEQTGVEESGVVTYLESDDGFYYVTSSKSVYFNLFNILEAFGYPSDDGYKPIKLKVTHSKSQFNNIQIGITFAGFA